MDNVQICDSYINNTPSTQTYRFYPIVLFNDDSFLWIRNRNLNII
jgi:hypothetical protein